MGWMPAIGSVAYGNENATAPNNFAVDIHGTSAHSRDDSRPRKWAAGKTGENHVLLRSEVLQNAQQLDIELINRGSLKNCPADPFHARAHLVGRHKLGALSMDCQRECRYKDEKTQQSKGFYFHGWPDRPFPKYNIFKQKSNTLS